MDRLRATLEAQQSDIQTARGEFERKTKQPKDKIAVKAHRKAGIDLGRRASKEYQEMSERATKTYVEKSKVSVSGGTAKEAHRNIPRPQPASSWTFEGTYSTKAEADAIRKAYRNNGYFVMVKRMGQGGYSLWIKPMGQIGGKRLKGLKGIKGERKGIVSQSVEIAGRTGANLTSLGSLPEYRPPNFALAKSGYKPLDYQSTYKQLNYKPISTEPMFKSFQPYKPVGNEPYYKKSEYVPIGEFGVKGSWAKKRKHKRMKAKRVRMVGVK